MPAIRTLALVLRTVEVFETSSVATVFTRELGKVSVLAKGAAGSSRRFRVALTCLGVSDMVILTKAGEALELLAEAAPVERFPSLRRDLAALYAGYYIAELLSDLTDLHDPHPKLFDAARITLRHLGDAGLRSGRILRFELACLRELGVMPSLDQCAQCGGDVAAARGKGVLRALERRSALSGLPARPAARRLIAERRPPGDSRPGQPGQRLARARLSPADTSSPRERPSARSSATFWAIVPDFGPCWESDLMLRGDRDHRTAPGQPAPRSRARSSIPVRLPGLPRPVAAPVARIGLSRHRPAPVLLRPVARASSAHSQAGGRPTTEISSRDQPRTKCPTSAAPLELR